MRLGYGNAVLVLLAAGCAAHSPPVEPLANSERAIERALEAGAGVAAPYELELARTKLELGKRIFEARDHKPARWLAEQAQVDAELARIKAVAAKAARVSPH